MIGWGLFGIFAVLYEATLAPIYSYDGLCYALDVEFAPPTNWFHPNHLLYTVVSRLLFIGYHHVNPGGRALFMMQSINALVAAGAVALFFVVVSRRYGPSIGILSAALLGFSHAFWAEVIDPGCYAWAALAAVILLEAMLRYDTDNALTVGCIAGAAVLFHQMLILAFPAFLLRGRGRQNLKFLAGAAITCGIPYATVMWAFHGSSFHEAFYWLLGIAGAPTPTVWGYWWQWGWLKNVYSSAGTLVGSFFPVRSWGSALAVGVGIALAAKGGKKQGVLWVWILVMCFFQFFYNPGVIRFRILLMPPLLYLIAGACASFPKKRGWAAVGILGVVLFGAVNLREVLALRRSFPTEAVRTQWIVQQLTRHDFLLIVGSGPDSIRNVYVAYFGNSIPVRSLYGLISSHPDGNLGELGIPLRSTLQSGGRVFVEPELLDAGFLQKTEADDHLPPGSLKRWFSSLIPQDILQGPSGYRLVRVDLRRAFQVK